MDRDIPSYPDWREPKPTFEFMLAQCPAGGPPVIRRVSVSQATGPEDVVNVADPESFRNTVAQSFGVSYPHA